MAEDIPYAVGSETDVGSVREQNQDAVGYFTTKDEAWTMLVVCDGMGGHAGGEMASKMAVEAIGHAFNTNITTVDPVTTLTQAIIAANDAIWQAAQQFPERRGMGTTVAALAWTGDQAYIAHVGDSRVYRVRPDSIERMTKDHSAVQRMVDGGLLTEEQAAEHPDSNILSMCVGAKETLEPEVRGPVTIEPGDRYLLCSDGLVPLVEDAFVAAMAMMYRPQEAVEKLIALANDRGGDDNISVQILHRTDAYPPTDKFEPDRFQLISASSKVPQAKPAPPQSVPPQASSSSIVAPLGGGDTAKVKHVSMSRPGKKGGKGAGKHEETLKERKTRTDLLDDPPRSKKKLIVIVVAAVLVLAALAVGALLLWKMRGQEGPVEGDEDREYYDRNKDGKRPVGRQRNKDPSQVEPRPVDKPPPVELTASETSAEQVQTADDDHETNATAESRARGEIGAYADEAAEESAQLGIDTADEANATDGQESEGGSERVEMSIEDPRATLEKKSQSESTTPPESEEEATESEAETD